MADLTSTDRKLMAALKRNARASITELAAELGVSRATIQTSMERLTKSGTIQRFTIEVDTAIGAELIKAVSTIELQGNLASSVIRTLRKMPEIVSLHTTNGAWDLVANIETSNLPEFDRVLRHIRDIPGVLNSESSLLLDSA